MPDWLAILKAYVDTLETIVGTEGGVALANKLTAARAALLDQITALRMAELDPANIPGDIDGLHTKAGTNADPAGTTTLFARLRQVVDSYLADGAIGLAAIEAFVDCLPAALGDLVTKNLAQILSDSVAFAGADIATIKGYVDCLPATLGDLVEKDLTAILSDSTAFAGADIALIKTQTDKLGDATIGLANLKALIDAITTYVDCLPAALGDLVTKNLAQILSDSVAFAGADIATIKGYVDCLPASLGDLVTQNLTAILSDSTAFAGADIAAIKAYVDLIDDATNGLAAIKAEVEGLAGAAMRGTDNAATAANLAAHEASQLTSRSVITDIHDTDLPAVKTDTAAIKTQTDKIAGKMLFSMDFWSVTLESITLTDIAAPGTDVALPNVVVDLPAGATVVRAVAMFKFRMLDNTGAANALQGDQYIGVQKGDAGGYANAIFLDDNMFAIAEATREGGDVVVGDLNVVAKVDGDATYNLQWTASLVDVANLKFCDVQTGLKIWYSV